MQALPCREALLLRVFCFWVEGSEGSEGSEGYEGYERYEGLGFRGSGFRPSVFGLREGLGLGISSSGLNAETL